MPSICRAARLTRRPPLWPFGSLPSSLGLGLGPALFLLGLGLAAPAAATPVELVASDARGVTLRLTVPPYGLSRAGADGRRELLIPRISLLDVPGRPKVPYATALIALPQGAKATATVIGEGEEQVVDSLRLTIGEKPVVRTDPDGLDYVPLREPVPPIADGAWPASPVGVGEPFTLRRQRVVVVQLQPFRYDVGTNRLWMRRTLTVRVTFTGGPGAGSLGVPAEDRGWEHVLKSTVLNYEQGRSWRAPRPVLGRGLIGRTGSTRAARVGQVAGFDESEPEVRVRIDSTGAWALDATELLAKGFPAGVPISEVSVHRHEFVEAVLAPNPPYVTYEIPVEVEDVDGDGTLSAGDRIVLYAQSWWVRSGLAYDLPLSYAQRNWGEADYVYVTRLRGGTGARTPARSGWLGLTLTPLASYPYTQRWEQNTSYISAPGDTTQDAFQWITRPNYYNPTQLAFETHDLDTTMAASVGAEWTGLLSRVIPGAQHFTWIAVKNALGQMSSVADSIMGYGKVTLTQSGQVFGSALSEGATNKFVIWGKHLDAPPDPNTNLFPDIALNWFEATYYRSYRAIQGYLACNNGTNFGNYEIYATGFSDSSALRVYDVTDSSAIQRLVATPKVQDLSGGTFGVHFQDSGAGGRRRRYVVFDTPLVPDTSDYGAVDRAAQANLYARPHGPGGGDYLLIVPEAFRSAVPPLVTLRQSQGLNVVVAPLEELNDAFNGGRKSPYAIKRFIRYAYDNWDARFVLLVGDGSEDPQNTAGYLPNGTPLSGVDWVPTQRILGPVTAVGSEPFLESIVSDPWYTWCVDCGDPFLAPKVPDLAIGRIPVHSLTEAGAVVSKLVNYETVTPDQTWRRKMVLVADDQYSGDIFGQIGAPTTYCRQIEEGVFAQITNNLQSIVLNEAGLGQSTPEVFDLSYYLPNYPTDIQGCSTAFDTCRCNGNAFISRAQLYATPALTSRLNEGRLWWNFQGHANETVLCHEALYSKGYNNIDNTNQIQNHGMPFLFTAFSCHPNAFGHYQENSVVRRGPPIGENLVDMADRGAIASWASSGFEQLPSSNTDHINLAFARALFVDPPRDPRVFDRAGGARVALGEVIAKGEVDYFPGPIGSPGERDVAISYNLLGDPATLISIGAPQAVFTANQAPVTDGVPVRLFTIGDTLRIEGDLVSNARIDTAWVERIEGTNVVATSLIDSLTPAFPDTTDASGGGRRYHVVYRTSLTSGSYTYRFRSIDRYGVQGRFDVVFQFQTQLTSEGGLVRDGDAVGPNAALTLLLLSPSPLVPATDLALFLNGQSIPFTAAPANNDHSGREWNLTWAHNAYADGGYKLDLSVMGVHAATHTFTVQSRLGIQNALAFPNPFNDTGGTVFSFYLETDRPTHLRVRVYTISGRVIYERTTDVVGAGYQQIQWNGRDAEGGTLASGVYFYRLAADNGVSSSHYIGRLVKVTKPIHIPDQTP